MEDKKGIYYYPFPQNKRVKMYVMECENTICFRMLNEDDPEMWANHGWVPYEAILQAQEMFTGEKFKPAQVYDIKLAKAILKKELAICNKDNT